jgi:hypothetical protein
MEEHGDMNGLVMQGQGMVEVALMNLVVPAPAKTPVIEVSAESNPRGVRELPCELPELALAASHVRHQQLFLSLRQLLTQNTSCPPVSDGPDGVAIPGCPAVDDIAASSGQNPVLQGRQGPAKQ